MTFLISSLLHHKVLIRSALLAYAKPTFTAITSGCLSWFSSFHLGELGCAVFCKSEQHSFICFFLWVSLYVTIISYLHDLAPHGLVFFSLGAPWSRHSLLFTTPDGLSFIIECLLQCNVRLGAQKPEINFFYMFFHSKCASIFCLFTKPNSIYLKYLCIS